MAKVQIKISPKTIIEAEGQTAADIFTQLGELESIFGIDRCGLCGHEGVKHVTRSTSSGHTFYDVQCTKNGCGATLGFMKGNQGDLFALTKEKDKSPKPNGGWSIYQGRGGQQPQHDPQQQTAESDGW